MENKNLLEFDYKQFVSKNLNLKFILYLRTHPEEPNEDAIIDNLVKKYGECKELSEERLTIFIVQGNKVIEFIDDLNSEDTSLYLSFIQSEKEMKEILRKSSIY